MGKTKIMISSKNLHSLRDSGKHPCGVCRKGVASNSILCCECHLRIHKKFSDIKSKLTADPSYECKSNNVREFVDQLMEDLRIM